MFWKSADPRRNVLAARWPMTRRLTLYYTLSVFVLLSAASALLYWELRGNLLAQDENFLTYKVQVLTELLEHRPLERSAVDQEVLEEAEISGQSPAPFFLRVLDDKGRPVDETPGMAKIVPVSAFPVASGGASQGYRWRSNKSTFLLASVSVPDGGIEARGWRIQAALNATAHETLLAGYRRDLGLVLATGLLLAALAGAWITRRGLRPLADITRATERVGVEHLDYRIQTGRWPEELASLASAFDRMLERLQQSFERLSQFSADLAHELRTPINNLMGEAQVTLSRTRAPAEYARVLQSALEEYSRLARMIDSMLFLAQADQARLALERVPLDARAEFQAVVDFYQALADEQRVELICEGNATILADPLLLRRALSNLLSNALKYTGSGGRITLRAGAAPDSAPVLTVIDTGSGIAAEHLTKLGDRFYRADPSRSNSPEGAGLGLAIVKSIIALHGGRLVVESAPGRGTEASLLFGPQDADLLHADGTPK
jgi:two-component system, OmpR family, heavy metal sensor histidine kinase CusS